MKRAVLVALAILSTAVFSLAQSDWVLVKTISTTKLYRNTRRVITSREGYVLSWEKRVHRTDTSEGRARKQQWLEIMTALVGKDKAQNYSYIVELTEYDCKGARSRTVRYMAYDNADNIIRVASMEDPEPEPSDELGEWKDTDPTFGMAKAACATLKRP